MHHSKLTSHIQKWWSVMGHHISRHCRSPYVSTSCYSPAFFFIVIFPRFLTLKSRFWRHLVSVLSTVGVCFFIPWGPPAGWCVRPIYIMSAHAVAPSSPLYPSLWNASAACIHGLIPSSPKMLSSVASDQGIFYNLFFKSNFYHKKTIVVAKCASAWNAGRHRLWKEASWNITYLFCLCLWFWGH